MSFEVAYQRLSQALSPAHERPDREDPSKPETILAMPIVLNLPKSDPPSRTQALEAAARAVVAVCLDPRAGQDGEFAGALATWYSHRIRKIARRARNQPWELVQALPGVTVDARARAFVPCPVQAVPKQIAKLQIGGTQIPADNPGAPSPGLPVIYVDASLAMSAGKAAAQVGHASMLLAANMPLEWVRAWRDKDFDLSVREVDNKSFQHACQQQGAVVVRDAGFTEVDPDSTTAVALPQAGPGLTGGS